MIRVQSTDEHGLALDVIQIDGGTQSRATLNQHVVDEYAEAIKGGAAFPPIVVFYDGKKHWLADGFHRFHAYQQIGRTNVAADVRQGTRRDAILHSVGANEAHGLRRTRDDKRRAVLTLLDDAEWSKWSDREIARRCAVGADLVGRLRPADTVAERQYVHPKTGAPTTMKVAGINADRSKTATVCSEEITPETVAPQGVEGGVEAQSTDMEITMMLETGAASSDAESEARAIQSAWDRACEPGRAMFLAANNLRQSNEAEAGGGDVDRSAKRADHPGQDWNAMSGKPRVRENETTVETLTSGPDDKRVSPSDGDAIAAVKGKARLANAAGVEPSPSESVSQLPADHPISRQVIAAPEVAPPTSGAPIFKTLSKADQIRLLRPFCQHPGSDLCGGSGPKHCHVCKKLMAESEAA